MRRNSCHADRWTRIKASSPTLSSCQRLTAAALEISARKGSTPFSGGISARASAIRGGSSRGRVPSRNFPREGARLWCLGCPRTRPACPRPGGPGDLVYDVTSSEDNQTAGLDSLGLKNTEQKRETKNSWIRSATLTLHTSHRENPLHAESMTRALTSSHR